MCQGVESGINLLFVISCIYLISRKPSLIILASNEKWFNRLTSPMFFCIFFLGSINQCRVPQNNQILLLQSTAAGGRLLCFLLRMDRQLV